MYCRLTQLLYALGVSLCLFACSGGGSGGDAVPGEPKVSDVTLAATAPADGETNVGLDSVVEIQFSQNVQAATVNPSTITLKLVDNNQQIAGSVIYLENVKRAIFTPKDFLQNNSTYLVEVRSGILDMDGLPLPARKFTFQTADTIFPGIIELLPFNGSKNVPLNAQITVRFSKAMDQSTLLPANFSLTGPMGMVATSLVYTAFNQTLTLTPTAPFEQLSTYTFAIAPGLLDTTGHALDAVNISFTTKLFIPGTVLLLGVGTGAADQIRGGSDEQGSFVVVWRQLADLDANGVQEYNLYASRFVLPSGPFSAPVVIDDNDEGSVDALELAVAPNGDATVIWQQKIGFLSQGDNVNSLYSAQFNPAAGIWNSRIEVETDTFLIADVANSGHAIIADAKNDFFSLWRQSFDGELSAYGSRLGLGANVWDARTLLEKGTDHDVPALNLLTMSNGQILGYYTHKRKPDSGAGNADAQDLYAVRYDPNSGWDARDTAVEDSVFPPDPQNGNKGPFENCTANCDTVDENIGATAVACSTDGTCLALWVYKIVGQNFRSIYWARYYPVACAADDTCTDAFGNLTHYVAQGKRTDNNQTDVIDSDAHGSNCVDTGHCCNADQSVCLICSVAGQGAPENCTWVEICDAQGNCSICTFQGANQPISCCDTPNGICKDLNSPAQNIGTICNIAGNCTVAGSYVDVNLTKTRFANAVVVCDANGNNCQICNDPSGVSCGANLMLCDETGQNCDTCGNDPNCNTRIFITDNTRAANALICDENGNCQRMRWGAKPRTTPIPMSVSIAGVVQNADSPKLVMYPDGSAIAAWTQEINIGLGVRKDLYTANFDPLTETWSSPALLEFDNTGDASAPELTLMSNGDLLAVWLQTVTSANPIGDDLPSIYARRYDLALGQWLPTGNMVPLEETGETIQGLRVKNFTGTNSAMVMWVQSRATGPKPSINFLDDVNLISD